MINDATNQCTRGRGDGSSGLCMRGISVENADNVFVFCCFMIYRRALSWQFASIAPTRHRITGHYMI